MAAQMFGSWTFDRVQRAVAVSSPFSYTTTLSKRRLQAPQELMVGGDGIKLGYQHKNEMVDE
jgi:hypothetical protein